MPTPLKDYPEGLKICNRCGETKPLTEFYKNGRKNGQPKSYCKACHKSKMMSRYSQGGRECQQDRRDQHRDAAKNSYHKNREANLQRVAIYRQANPEKLRAHWAASWAVKKGLLIQPDNCSRCDAPTSLEKHHPDYTKPSEVEWLCVPCHRLHHLEKEQNNGNQGTYAAVGREG